MKKIILAALLVASVNLGSVRVDAPGVSVTFGSRNDRGYYWDGYDWREPAYWKQHGGPRGERYYTGRGNKHGHHKDGGHCPPGQAKKGNC